MTAPATLATRMLAALLLTVALPAAAAERVVAVGALVTETAAAIGALDEIVAVDQTSLYPPEVTRLPNVGYLRSLAAEGLLALRPTLILAAPEAGPADVLARVAAAGPRLVHLPDGFTAEAVTGRVRAIGAALHREAAATAMAQAMAEDFAALAAAVPAEAPRPKVLFLLSLSRGGLMASGRGTLADALIALAHGTNAVTGYSGYKPLSAEAAMLAAPDWIVMTQQTLDGQGGADRVLALPELRHTPAGRNRRLVTFDAVFLLGFGPRTAHAAHALAAATHPDRTLPPLPDRPWSRTH